MVEGIHRSYRIAWLLAAIGLLAVPTWASSSSRRAKPPTTQQIVKQCLPSIVSITVLNAQGEPAVQGSGFVIAPNLIATNVHVVADAHSVTANFPNGRSEKVFGIVDYDTDKDMCLIYANTNGVAPLTLATLDNVEVGDPVMALGCPEGLGASVSTGIVSGIRNYKGTKIVQTTAPISHGSSGGALVDSHGRVLGITSFFVQDGQNLNFAYATKYLKDLIPHGLITYMSWAEIEQWRATHPAEAANTTPAPDQAASTSTTPQPTTSTSTHAGSTSSAVTGTSYTDKPLAGLKGVAVDANDVGADPKADGVDIAALKSKAIDRLKAAGIPIFEGSGSSGNDSAALLDLSIGGLRNDAGNYSYTITWELIETVRLVREAPVVTYGQTWRSEYYGNIGRYDLAKTLSDTSDTAIDDFIKAYKEQNPAK